VTGPAPTVTGPAPTQSYWCSGRARAGFDARRRKDAAPLPFDARHAHLVLNMGDCSGADLDPFLPLLALSALTLAASLLFGTAALLSCTAGLPPAGARRAAERRP
jgi:hypothetical protein